MIMAMIKNILITMDILMTIKILAMVTLKAYAIAGNNNRHYRYKHGPHLQHRITLSSPHKTQRQLQQTSDATPRNNSQLFASQNNTRATSSMSLAHTPKRI